MAVVPMENFADEYFSHPNACLLWWEYCSHSIGIISCWGTLGL